MITAEMKRVLAENTPAYVATVCPDGTPNVSPKGTVIAWDDRRIVFLDLRSPETVRNLRSSPGMEINVVDPLVRKGFRFKGTAEVLVEGALYDEVTLHFERRIGMRPERVRGVVVMEVASVRPLISPAYDVGATEQEIREKWCKRFLHAIERARASASP